ncbi:amidase [Kroppenstedtia pulmonis]|uniref:Amidase n=2 Tax=Kroppenstedtia pulmonis TaxID=1380685 RepID=A0A7D3Y2P5_9BACL|nr:amidase [Kroppenstedtia pulmonis]
MNVWDLDACGVLEAMGSGKVTSAQAVQGYRDQIERTNPTLNYLVEDRFAKALQEAKECDRRQQEGTGKLWGVPISIKEAYNVAGMKTTGGLFHRKDQVEESDAAVTAKLKAAGAVILGKTNTPTLCFCQESENKLYGRTNNPWNPERTAGGSSSGEGAIIAVGGAAAGIGSDIGGSIRFPSHFNGVVGFKSGHGQVDQQGHFPFVDHPLQERMLGLGPMTKSVRDTRLIYNIIAKTPAPKKEVADYVITFLPQTTYPLSKVTVTLMHQVKAFFNKELETEEAVPPWFDPSALMWQEIMSVDGGEGTAKIAFGDRAARPVWEYLKEITTGKSEWHRHLTWALIGARLFRPGAKRVREIEEILHQGDEELDRYLDKRILVFPVYHCGAPIHGDLYREIFSIRKTFLRYMPYVAYANVWGLPSLTIPVGTDGDGMPISLQLMSRNRNEEALFQLGEIVEKQFRGYLRCDHGEDQ